MSDGLLRNPFVVQCRECKKILTDSFTLQTMKHGYLMHTHGMVPPLDAVRPGEGVFDGCMLRGVECSCGAPVGVYLVSAGMEWNGYADAYGFSRDMIVSYVLGNEVSKEKGMYELMEDIEKLKAVVSKIYKKVFQ